jgi:positive regulator of sigma E activity
MAAVPPVVDHVKRTIVQEIAAKSPFNVFNIVAIVAILVIGYYLYRKFNQKFAKGAIRMPRIIPNRKGPGPSPVEAVGEPQEESEEEGIEEVDEAKED